eukprot:gene18135-24575_t
MLLCPDAGLCTGPVVSYFWLCCWVAVVAHVPSWRCLTKAKLRLRAQRALISSLNGLAACMLLERNPQMAVNPIERLFRIMGEQQKMAVNTYREAVRIMESNRKYIDTDPLMRLIGSETHIESCPYHESKKVTLTTDPLMAVTRTSRLSVSWKSNEIIDTDP